MNWSGVRMWFGRKVLNADERRRKRAVRTAIRRLLALEPWLYEELFDEEFVSSFNYAQLESISPFDLAREWSRQFGYLGRHSEHHIRRMADSAEAFQELLRQALAEHSPKTARTEGSRRYRWLFPLAIEQVAIDREEQPSRLESKQLLGEEFTGCREVRRPESATPFPITHLWVDNQQKEATCRKKRA